MRTARPAVVTALLLLAACTTHPDVRPASELRALRAERQLQPVVERVLTFRNGLLGEALDRGRLDREERAAAATREIAELTLLLDEVPAELGVDAAVDRDLARMLLDAAVFDMTLAHAKEPELRHIAGPATALAFLADPAPPSPA